jgi:uncharacterized LabA/DUF88 family protein
MRIGFDVAALALNRQVDLIVVASNDTELIPAFKLSRRHGRERNGSGCGY